MCHSGFRNPTTHPNRFFTPRVSIIMPWVLSLGRLMTMSASRASIGEVDLAEGLADVHFAGSRKFGDLHIEPGQGLQYAVLFQDALKRAYRLAVADLHPAALFEDVLRDGPDHEGVGQNGIFGLCRRQEIRLEEHASSPVHPAAPEGVENLEDPRLQACHSRKSLVG